MSDSMTAPNCSGVMSPRSKRPIRSSTWTMISDCSAGSIRASVIAASTPWVIAPAAQPFQELATQTPSATTIAMTTTNAMPHPTRRLPRLLG